MDRWGIAKALIGVGGTHGRERSHIAAAVDPPKVVVQVFAGAGFGGGLGGGGGFGGGGEEAGKVFASWLEGDQNVATRRAEA